MRLADGLVRDGESGNLVASGGLQYCVKCHTWRPAESFGGHRTCGRCRDRARAVWRRRQDQMGGDGGGGTMRVIGVPDCEPRGLLCRQGRRRGIDRGDEVVWEVM